MRRQEESITAGGEIKGKRGEMKRNGEEIMAEWRNEGAEEEINKTDFYCENRETERRKRETEREQMNIESK